MKQTMEAMVSELEAAVRIAAKEAEAGMTPDRFREFHETVVILRFRRRGWRIPGWRLDNYMRYVHGDTSLDHGRRHIDPGQIAQCIENSAGVYGIITGEISPEYAMVD